MRRFGVDLKYCLFAIAFATRPANFCSDPSRRSAGILSIVFRKHPLGSNILPFLLSTKVDREQKKAAPLQLCCFEVEVRPGGANATQTGWEASAVPLQRPLAVLHAARAPCNTPRKGGSRVRVNGGKSYRVDTFLKKKIVVFNSKKRSTKRTVGFFFEFYGSSSKILES